MSLTPQMIQELKSLETGPNREILPEDVVEKARDTNSALHTYPGFEWDVNKAAYKSWMEAARSVIQVYVTILPRGDGSTAQGREYANVKVVENGVSRQVYRPTEIVLRDNRVTLINSVLDRIVSAISSYPLVEFDPILEVVDEVRRQANQPPPRRRGARAGVGPRPSRRGGGGEARPD